MTSAARFLNALAQAVSVMGLYRRGHPALEKAVDRAYDALSLLIADVPAPVFTFLGADVVLGEEPLFEMRGWPWGPRLAAIGIQRLEFVGAVARDDFESLLETVHQRLTGAGAGTAEVRPERATAVRFGHAGLRGDAEADPAEELETATLSYSLREEIQGVRWLHGELQSGRGLQMLEAEGIIRSLTVAMHAEQELLVPLVRLKEYDQYTVTHALNVSVLSMALAEFLGLGRTEVRAFGTAGLLHDLGKVAVPKEILNKPGKLTDLERATIARHTVEGARMILESEEKLDLAAVVAFEHHIRIDGGGYPRPRHPRPCHRASNLVHVCDVYDALRTRRPYRDAWPAEKTLDYIERGAGTEFDEAMAGAFVAMMRRWQGRVAEVPFSAPELDGVLRTSGT